MPNENTLLKLESFIMEEGIQLTMPDGWFYLVKRQPTTTINRRLWEEMQKTLIWSTTR